MSFKHILNQLLTVGWLASEGVVWSWCCLWYELSPFAAASCDSQRPQ